MKQVMINIKLNDPQPVDCPNCHGRYGYKIVYRIQKYVDNIYDKEGNYNGCTYSESEKVIGQLKTIVCENCNNKLPFRCQSQ